ncbi:unnamed protein product [Sympodiomycopsis kandeliae]
MSGISSVIGHNEPSAPPANSNSSANQHVINIRMASNSTSSGANDRQHQQQQQHHQQQHHVPSHLQAVASPGSYTASLSPVQRSPIPPGPASSSSGLGSLGFDHLDSRATHSIAAYATPRLPNTSGPIAPPQSQAAKDALSRSLSMGRAAYNQQNHNHQQLQHHQQHHQLASPHQSHPQPSTSPSFLASQYSPSTASGSSSSAAAAAAAAQRRHSHYMPQSSASPLYAESSRNAANRASLLPTINPHSSAGYGYAGPSSSARSPSNLDANMTSYGGGGSSGSAAYATGSRLSTGGYHSNRASRDGSFDMTQQLTPNSMSVPMDYSTSDARRNNDIPSPATGGLGASADGTLPYAYASPSSRMQSASTHQQQQQNHSTQSPYGSQQQQQQASMRHSTYGDGPLAQPNQYQQQQSGLSRSGTMRARPTPGTQVITTAPTGIENMRAPAIKEEGLRRVRDLSELRPKAEATVAATTRRADPAGGYVSPLKAMTSYLHHTYHLVNPSFIYELSFNPRRVLTKPSEPKHNNGHDNEDSDYILYVNDWLGSEEGNRYLILDVLGQGTFGQVVKCQNMRTHEIVAVKVIKNKPAYYKQSMMEVTILEMLNMNWDPEDKHHILRLYDTFIHAEHLCLVFELLSSNLYELIKQNSFHGLSTSLVRVFTTQLLDALTVLNEAKLIHCDLKPENILLRTLQTPSIKLVDFGSACHEKQTVYTYIQSRFYRSPEVLLGLPYNSAIDMWSLGCIAVELFLGLPLFPGTSEYNQICRIVQMLGLPPTYMLEQGKQTQEFFNIYTDEYGRKTYRLKSLEQYSKEHNVQETPSKKYFAATTLPEIIKTYPLSRKAGKPADAQKEMANRASFVDFVSGLLNMDPHERWNPQQSKLHPFITGEKFTKAFKPPRLSPDLLMSGRPNKSSSSAVDPNKHQFGGLPQATQKTSGRAYHDAAAYNQHLAQQQAYNSAHQARQSQPLLNNPYARDAAASQAQAQADAQAKSQAYAEAQAQAQMQAQQAAQAHAAMIGYGGPLPGLTSNNISASGSGFTTRSRSNTQSQHGSMPGVAGKSNASTGLPAGLGLPTSASATMSLLGQNRDDWERRNSGTQPQKQQRQSSQFPSSDLLQSSHGLGDMRGSPNNQQQWQQQQQQVQGGSASGNWTGTNPYTSPRQGSTQTPSRQYHSPSGFSVVVEGHERQNLPNPHDGAGMASSPGAFMHHQQSSSSSEQQQQQAAAAAAATAAAVAKAGGIAAPPAAYSSAGGVGVAGGSGSGSSSSRYDVVASGGQYPTGGMLTSSVGGGNGLPPFDAFDSTQSSIAQLMPALQPQQYHHQHQQQQQQQRHSMIMNSGGGSGGGGGYLNPNSSGRPGLASSSSSSSSLNPDDPFQLAGHHR